MIKSSPFRKFQSPPTRSPFQGASPGNDSFDFSSARNRSHHKVAGAAVALGVGLGVAFLLSGGEPVPPAADPGAHELQDPELVVMDAALDRIDLSRETTTSCVGSGEDEICTESNVDYHSLGLHVGHGVVQDLNGNLFVAPQIAARIAPAQVLVNPDSVTVDGPLWSDGSLTQNDNGDFVTQGAHFNRHTIRLQGEDATVSTRGLLGSYESNGIRNNNGVITIQQSGWNQEIVQSQGDHLLIQTPYGRNLGEVRHDSEAGSLSVVRKSLFGQVEHHVTYSPSEYLRSSNDWGSSQLSVQRTTDGEGNQTLLTDGGFWGGKHVTTTTEQGWSTTSGSFGSTYDYDFSGGELLGGTGNSM